MSERFEYKAQGKLRKAILSLALGWREESGALTDAKSSDDPALDPIIVAERPGDGFEWRPAQIELLTVVLDRLLTVTAAQGGAPRASNFSASQIHWHILVCINTARPLIMEAAGSIIAFAQNLGQGLAPMPVTLRYVLPDAGTKLRQLEVDTDALHQVARAFVPTSPRRRPIARFIRRLALSVWVFLWPAYRVARSSLVAFDRTVRSPRLATALRIARGCLSEGVRYSSLAFGILLALSLVILLVAPPE